MSYFVYRVKGISEYGVNKDDIILGPLLIYKIVLDEKLCFEKRNFKIILNFV